MSLYGDPIQDSANCTAFWTAEAERGREVTSTRQASASDMASSRD